MIKQNELVKVLVPVKRISLEQPVEPPKDPKALPEDWHDSLLRSLRRMQP